ncbi:MAG: hypothetical protein ABW321_33600 [Polyangiales bacterium]
MNAQLPFERFTRYLAALLALGVWWTPGVGHACFPYGCAKAFAPASGATIPENAPAIAWRTFAANREHLRPSLAYWRLEGTERVPMAFELEPVSDTLLWVHATLEAGRRYRVQELGEDDDPCDGYSVEFDVSKAAPLPERLGILELTTEREGCVAVSTGTSICIDKMPAAYRHARLVYDDLAAPWQPLLLLQLVVDDEPWQPGHLSSPSRYAPVIGEASTVVLTECAWPEGHPRGPGIPAALREGVHSARVEARVPGVTQTVATAEQAFALCCRSDAPAQAVAADECLWKLAAGDDAGVWDALDDAGVPDPSADVCGLAERRQAATRAPDAGSRDAGAQRSAAERSSEERPAVDACSVSTLRAAGTNRIGWCWLGLLLLAGQRLSRRWRRARRYLFPS